MTENPLRPLLTLDEVAFHLKKSKQWVRNQLTNPNSKLEGIKIGREWRIDPVHFAKYVAGKL